MESTVMDGDRIGRPSSRSPARCISIASRRRALVSSIEVPVATHPGRSGTWADQLDPQGSRMIAYRMPWFLTGNSRRPDDPARWPPGARDPQTSRSRRFWWRARCALRLRIPLRLSASEQSRDEVFDPNRPLNRQATKHRPLPIASRPTRTVPDPRSRSAGSTAAPWRRGSAARGASR
jgi:hypothetical protein